MRNNKSTSSIQQSFIPESFLKPDLQVTEDQWAVSYVKLPNKLMRATSDIDAKYLEHAFLIIQTHEHIYRAKIKPYSKAGITAVKIIYKSFDINSRFSDGQKEFINGCRAALIELSEEELISEEIPIYHWTWLIPKEKAIELVNNIKHYTFDSNSPSKEISKINNCATWALEELCKLNIPEVNQVIAPMKSTGSAGQVYIPKETDLQRASSEFWKGNIKFLDPWEEIKQLKSEANSEDISPEEAQQKRAIYKETRDKLCRKDFNKKYPQYANQLEESDRLKNYPIKRIIAPFCMFFAGGKGKRIDPLSLLPYPRTEREAQGIFYLWQKLKQVTTALCTIGIDFVLIPKLKVPYEFKLACTFLVSSYALYTMYRQGQEAPPKYEPYTLEEIIDGVEKVNASNRYGIRYPYTHGFKNHSSIMTIQNKGEVGNAK
jgi:hypothetical protein